MRHVLPKSFVHQHHIPKALSEDVVVEMRSGSDQGHQTDRHAEGRGRRHLHRRRLCRNGAPRGGDLSRSVFAERHEYCDADEQLLHRAGARGGIGSGQDQPGGAGPSITGAYDAVSYVAIGWLAAR
jgi:hypothetical protein